MTDEHHRVGYRLTVSIVDGFRLGIGFCLAVVVVRLTWRIVAFGIDLPRAFLE